MKQSACLAGASSAIVLAVAGAASAHTGMTATSGFAAGFGHPLGGLDHLLAMVAVGMWAAQLTGRAVWALPLTFMGVMALAGVLGVAGVPLGPVEFGIAASVVVLGAVVAFRARLPLAVAAILVGLFALFHGHAHGAEMPATVSGVAYSLGFVLTTGLLHAAGLGMGSAALGKAGQALITRLSGGAIAAAGLALMIG